VSWKEDRRDKTPYCERCGEKITNISKAATYRSGGPYYETIYICEECLKLNKEVKDDGK